MDFQETQVELRFSSDKVLRFEASEAYWSVQEMREEAAQEFESELKQDRAVLEKLRAWASSMGVEISVGQAEAVEIAIYRGYEEHKKKLPEWPKLLASTASTPPSSPPGSTAPSTTTSGGSGQPKSSSNGASQTGESPQTEQSNS